MHNVTLTSQHQQPRAIPGENPRTCRCSVGKVDALAAAAGAKTLTCSFDLLRERQLQTATRGMLKQLRKTTTTKKILNIFASLHSPKMRQGAPMAKQGLEPHMMAGDADYREKNISVSGTTKGQQTRCFCLRT